MYKVFHIHFDSPYRVHYGQLKTQPVPIIDSSTILRSLIYASHLLYDEDQFNEIIDWIVHGKLRISSVLPTVKQGKEFLYLLPIPYLIKAKIFKAIQRIEHNKKIKTIEWISLGTLAQLRDLPLENMVLKEMQSNDSKETLLIIDINGKLFIIYNRVLVTEKEFKTFKEVIPSRFYERVIIPKNRIDRVSSASDVFNLAAYKSITTNYVILYVEDDYIAKYIHSALKLLSDLNIGSRRRVGYGHFKILAENDFPSIFNYLFEDYYSAWVPLGLYVPSRTVLDSILWEKSYLRVEKYYGLAGDGISYKLPYLNCIVARSTLIFPDKSTMPTGLIHVERKPFESYILYFNPLFYGVKYEYSDS